MGIPNSVRMLYSTSLLHMLDTVFKLFSMIQEFWSPLLQ